MNYSEKYGNSIDEAVGLALKDLKVDKDAVTVTVLKKLTSPRSTCDTSWARNSSSSCKFWSSHSYS